jgi:hypothetical protein
MNPETLAFVAEDLRMSRLEVLLRERQGDQRVLDSIAAAESWAATGLRFEKPLRTEERRALTSDMLGKPKRGTKKKTPANPNRVWMKRGY